MFNLITSVLRARTGVSPYSGGRHARIALRLRSHPLRRIFRFPIWEQTPQPVHFPVDLIPSFLIL